MSREIRVSIDDDEVFERMKHRKQQLDLSWEEVLRRGLRRYPDHGDSYYERNQSYRYSGQERNDRSRGQPGDLGEDIARHVQNRVADTLRDSMRGVLGDVPGPVRLGHGEFESELGSLERGEDAMLEFPFLDDALANQIPLRVDLRTSADGLDVDVVTIRQGKSVSEMNRFTPDTRKAITKSLARDGEAVIRLATDDETYRVAPVLSWSRDSTGRPTITSVEIETVMFD